MSGVTRPHVRHCRAESVGGDFNAERAERAARAAASRASTTSPAHPNAPPPPLAPEAVVLAAGGGAVDEGGGPFTVIVIVADAVRFAPSTTSSVRSVVPPAPAAAVTVTMQFMTATPHVDGVIVNPAAPAATIAGGTSAALLLVTVKCRLPVPDTVKG